MANIYPVLEAINKKGNILTAVWGYDNTTTKEIKITSGNTNNYFKGTKADLGQPSIFYPGRHKAVFRTVLNTPQQTWIVKYSKPEQDTASIYSLKKVVEGGDIKPLRADENPLHSYNRGPYIPDLIANKHYIAPHYYSLLGLDRPHLNNAAPTPAALHTTTIHQQMNNQLPQRAAWANPTLGNGGIPLNSSESGPYKTDNNMIQNQRRTKAQWTNNGGGIPNRPNIEPKLIKVFLKKENDYIHGNIIGNGQNFQYKD